MRKAASWNGYLNKARFGGVNQGLIYVLVGVVVVVLLALPMVHKMNNDVEESPEPVSENNTQAQGNTDPVNPAEWRTDYEIQLANAKETGKPLLIYIHSEEATRCPIIQKEVFGNEEVQEKIKNHLKVKVHALEQDIIDMERSANAGSLIVFASHKYSILNLNHYNKPSDISKVLSALDTLIPPELR